MLVLTIRGCASCHFIEGISKLRIQWGTSIVSDYELKIDDLPVVEVPVSSLSLGHSPRVAGHERVLCGAWSTWCGGRSCCEGVAEPRTAGRRG
jgi:hypothetical protein